jgi:hypothetical protein
MDQLQEICGTGQMRYSPKELSFYQLDTGELLLVMMHVERYQREEFYFYCFTPTDEVKFLCMIRQGETVEHHWIPNNSTQ